MTLVQFGKIIGLQNHVSKLSKADATALALDTLLYRLLLNHGVDREVLAYIPKEGQHIHVFRPVQIIDDFGRDRTGVKINKTGHLGLKLIYPVRHNIRRIELTLLSFEAWISNQASCTTHKRQGFVASQLKPAQHQQGHQGADMKAVGGRIKAAIKRARPAV